MIDKTYDVTARVQLTRKDDFVFVHIWGFSGPVSVKLTLEEAHKLGRFLIDVADDATVEAGAVGAEPNGYVMDERDAKEETR